MYVYSSLGESAERTMQQTIALYWAVAPSALVLIRREV